MQRTIDLTGQETIHGECEVETASPRISYPQDWQAYNDAQTNEKLLFIRLLHELTSQIPIPERTGPGRPSADLGEMIFSCCLKIYLNFSSRRAESDLKVIQQLGYVGHAPHFNTILKYLGKPELKPVLTSLVEFSALPLTQLEETFAVDSTGFSTSIYSRWYNARVKMADRRLYRKAHVMCGTKTKVITSIQVTQGNVSDFDMFPSLVESTSKHFEMKEILADKGYSSRRNLDIVSDHGATPYILFHKNVVRKAMGSSTWKMMVKYFHEHKDEFMDHYHMRSNVESVFSMMKRKQGVHLRTKSEDAQFNEILCKALVHNICVLIQEMFEHDVHIDFQAIAEDELMCKMIP